MNENINLCELLKGHEGEIFYSPAFGDVKLVDIGNNDCDDKYIIHIEAYDRFAESYYLTSEGKYDDDNGECMLFPSKGQRYWSRWVEEQKPKAPKTWNEMKSCNVEVWQAISHLDYGSTEPILKSAVALIKIHQLIEVGYGGNPTFKEKVDDNNLWMVTIHTYSTIDDCNHNSYTIGIEEVALADNPIVFHSYEQAKEFLSYPENVQLLRDFYMI